MSCLNPNLMLDRGVCYKPSERYKFLGSLKGYCEREGRSADELLRNPSYMLVPCKHCLACQRAKAMDWATRAAQEILYHPKGTSYFSSPNELLQQSKLEQLKYNRPGVGIIEANEEALNKLWEDVKRRTKE